MNFQNKIYENEAVLASLKNKLKDLDPDSGSYKLHSERLVIMKRLELYLKGLKI